MNIDTALIGTCIEAEQIAAEHLDYIKSGGEGGCSAMLRMAMFEMTKEGEAYASFYTWIRKHETKYFSQKRVLMRNECIKKKLYKEEEN